MAFTETAGNTAHGGEYSNWRSEPREPGARRKKLGEYLKAANELRQNYFSGDDGGSRGHHEEGSDSVFPDAAVVRSGHEEMILFPSYGRKHVKSKLETVSGNNETEQDFWRREWDKYQNDTAVVDVDVRGWLYTPHRGPATRKQRLFIGMARQVTGLPAPTRSDSNLSSQTPSRASSPSRLTAQEEAIVARETEQLVRISEEEQRNAQHGKFSENPNRYRETDNPPSGQGGREITKQAHVETMSLHDDPAIGPLQTRSSWTQPSRMSAAELQVANNHLLNRIKPFMANPLPDSPISAFFYNESSSRQHTVYTNPSGHFTLRASLDFVPTHVRVFAGEKLSVTEEVHITPSKGVSLISDIDDTIKHSAISAGAREIFRNAFIRDLSDLTIDGVREWYTTLNDMGVKMHYVSNSPWQMYPILTSFFKMAHLPKGSFHLKQYAGLLQGIFEPVAERKKSSLEKILRDFPDRKFILVGDSGEADLEVYTDVALDNPGKILGIFIRDVTSPVSTGYFDPSMPSRGRHSRHHSRHRSGDNLAMSKRLSRPDDAHDDDADLRAAIAASLRDMEEEARNARKSINPDAYTLEKFTGQEKGSNRPTLPLRPSEKKFIPESRLTASPDEDLIDFSDSPDARANLSVPPVNGSQKLKNASRSSQSLPAPPPKPTALRSPSPNPMESQSKDGPVKMPPPRPLKPSSTIQPSSLLMTKMSENAVSQTSQRAQANQPSPLSQVTQQESAGKDRPPLPARPRTYRGFAKEKIASVYNSLPSAGGWVADPHLKPPADGASDQDALRSSRSVDNLRNDKSAKTAPPPPPPRRTLPLTGNSLSTAATKSGRTPPRPRSEAWSDDSLPGSPGDGVGRKEYLWQQRWARSCGLLEPQGVTLRTWRVGSDVANVCVRLVEMMLREIDKEERMAADAGGGSNNNDRRR
ncbi:phosphatidate phosphatase app1 [Acrodontium crateriforme]|uniref:Phosphatidate phosphatase app1 n=1 Tax=Acrodontium crateriforme TaxID=150365 RepID=A0AAQ3MAZ2_9PEZI|nr:phosphatidate phosphatase app1 [Acrodontium crateriforme]